VPTVKVITKAVRAGVAVVEAAEKQAKQDLEYRQKVLQYADAVMISNDRSAREYMSASKLSLQEQEAKSSQKEEQDFEAKVEYMAVRGWAQMNAEQDNKQQVWQQNFEKQVKQQQQEQQAKSDAFKEEQAKAVKSVNQEQALKDAQQNAAAAKSEQATKQMLADEQNQKIEQIKAQAAVQKQQSEQTTKTDTAQEQGWKVKQAQQDQQAKVDEANRKAALQQVYILSIHFISVHFSLFSPICACRSLLLCLNLQ
jgi:hypothetical protein